MCAMADKEGNPLEREIEAALEEIMNLTEELQCLKDAYHAKGWPIPEKTI